jgi:hypothetical protein
LLLPWLSVTPLGPPVLLTLAAASQRGPFRPRATAPTTTPPVHPQPPVGVGASGRCKLTHRRPFSGPPLPFSFPSSQSQQGRSFYQSVRNHRAISGVCRAEPPDPGAPWPVSDWPPWPKSQLVKTSKTQKPQKLLIKSLWDLDQEKICWEGPV